MASNLHRNHQPMPSIHFGITLRPPDNSGEMPQSTIPPSQQPPSQPPTNAKYPFWNHVTPATNSEETPQSAIPASQPPVSQQANSVSNQTPLPWQFDPRHSRTISNGTAPAAHVIETTCSGCGASHETQIDIDISMAYSVFPPNIGVCVQCIHCGYGSVSPFPCPNGGCTNIIRDAPTRTAPGQSISCNQCCFEFTPLYLSIPTEDGPKYDLDRHDTFVRDGLLVRWVNWYCGKCSRGQATKLAHYWRTSDFPWDNVKQFCDLCGASNILPIPPKNWYGKSLVELDREQAFQEEGAAWSRRIRASRPAPKPYYPIRCAWCGSSVDHSHPICPHCMRRWIGT